MMRRAGRGVALLPLLALASCASTLDLQPPQLSVVSMKVQSADLFSQRVNVRMRVTNPNARELPVKAIKYRIEVNGTEFAEGLADTPFVVPAQGEADFDLPITANLASVLPKLLTSRSSGTLDYRLVGDVSLSSGFLRRIPFDERGSVKLK
jgi:LEA14-like dessication related protein